MAETVKLLNPKLLKRNQDNPRLIFRQEDMDPLEQSIADQGILVPLTVYQEGKHYRLLDGERRWKCALKLGLPTVPTIIQPKPERLQNIMMMFAIHHARTDWDPLPTALKLKELEAEFTDRHGRKPREAELAGLASMSRGEVRRLRKLQALPQEHIDELLMELEKPASDQTLTVDHVLEATSAARTLRRRGILSEADETSLRRAIVEKFRSQIIKNTTDPRLLTRIARAVQRGEVSPDKAAAVINRIITHATYTPEQAFRDSVEQIDFEHNLEKLTDRMGNWLEQHQQRGYELSAQLRQRLKALTIRIKELLDL